MHKVHATVIASSPAIGVPRATLYSIHIDGCDLCLYSGELRRGLLPEMWERGLKRGKAIRRAKAYDERMRKREAERA